MADDEQDDLDELDDEPEVELFPVPGDGLTQEERLDNAIARIDGVTIADDAVDDEAAYEGQVAYGRSWSFNHVERRFDRYGTEAVETTGIETLKVWCEKVLHTLAGSHVIYPDYIGIDFLDIIGNQYDEGTMATLMDTVREALLVHERIERVDDLAVQRDLDDDYVIVSMTIVTDSDDQIDLTTEVAAG